MSEFHNDATSASDSLAISMSDEKLRMLHPDLFGIKAMFFRFAWHNSQLNAVKTKTMLAEHICLGDSRAAVVMRVEPLIVAAYTDELDCVALLKFPTWLVEDYQLKAGSKLLTVNTYGRGQKITADLSPGAKQLGNWSSFFPVIAEFVSDDIDAITNRKRSIVAAEWKRAVSMGLAKLAYSKALLRDGSPLKSWKAGISEDISPTG